MKIKEVIKVTGLTDRAIRLYIENELVKPECDENYNGRKSIDFSENDVEQLKNIAMLRKAGFSIAEIKSLQMGGEQAQITIKEYINKTSEKIEVNTEILEKIGSLAYEKNITVEIVCERLLDSVSNADIPKEDMEIPANLFVKKIVKIAIIAICVIAVLLVAIICSYINSKDFYMDRIDDLFLSSDYENVCEEYEKFFNDFDYEKEVSEYYGDSCEDVLVAYKTKYLMALLYTGEQEKFTAQIVRFGNEYDVYDFSNFLMYLYEAYYNETLKETNEKNVIGLLEESKISFNNEEKNLYYNSFLCFCQFAYGDNNTTDLVEKIKTQCGDSFSEYWDKECVKYCGSLLLKRDYDRFDKTFIKSYGVDFNTTSIAIMINRLGCDNEQLQILSDSLRKFSDIVEDRNIKEASRMLAKLAIEKNPNE